MFILKTDHLWSFFNIIYTFFGSIFASRYIHNHVITNRVIKRLKCNNNNNNNNNNNIIRTSWVSYSKDIVFPVFPTNIFAVLCIKQKLVDELPEQATICK